MNRHVLVTGGAGFIGSHLVDRLLSQEWRVTVVDNFDNFYDPDIKRHNIRSHIDHPHYRLVEADITDDKILYQELNDDYDVIVHLAAKAGVRPSVENPMAYQKVNVCGTLNVLELAKEKGIKQFVFASSSSVYGANPRLPWREEDCVLQPLSPYAATKISGELLGHVYSHIYGIRFIALRIFTAYGPRQRPDLAIHKFAKLMLEGKVIPIYGDGSTFRDYTYVGDIVAGIEAAIEYKERMYEVFNLGSGQPVTLLGMVQCLEKILGVKAKLQYDSPQQGDVKKTWADIAKGKELLGWQAIIDFSRGVELFINWINQDKSEYRYH